MIEVDGFYSRSADVDHLRGGDGCSMHGVNVPLEGQAEFNVELVIEGLEGLRLARFRLSAHGHGG
jgi:hypothetical protein